MHTTIRGTATPVVHHIVTYIQPPGVSTGTIQASAKAPSTSLMMGEEVMMKGAHIASYCCRKAMLHGIVGTIIVLMAILIERLTDDIMLETIVDGTAR